MAVARARFPIAGGAVGVLLLAGFGAVAEIPVGGAADTELRVDRRTGRVESLKHVPSGASWVNDPFPLFEAAGPERVRTTLDVQPTAEGILLALRIVNGDAGPQVVTPVFPHLWLRGADAAEHRLLRYCFPARAALVGRENRSDAGWYSGIFPAQFMAVDHPALGSLHVVIRDTSNSNRKTFELSKTDNGLRLSARYEPRTLAPGEAWDLPPVLLATTNGTWHSGLAAYRDWLKTWYRPAVPRRSEFREVFNFRVCYLSHDDPRLNSGAFDPKSGKWTLREALGRDARDFGGLDFVHLFDWARTPESGRVGDYAPWSHLGGLERFREEIRALREGGLPTGLYLEGYLVSPESRIARKSGADWMMADGKGQRVDPWGGGYFTMCQHVPGWQDYLAAACGRLARETGAAGLYLDEYGFLCQYRCSNASHGKFHSPGAHMLAGEYDTLRKVRAAVGERAVLYTEEVPTDVMTQFCDGAYTGAVKNALRKGVACPVHLTRFALPDFKTIELLSEEGLRDGDLAGVRAAFFNGEGLYLSGNAGTFSADGLALIRKTHALLRGHADAFTSMEPMPLVPTLEESVFANRFPAGRRVVWTFLNGGTQPFEGPLLRVPHRPGARYRDAWNGVDLTPDVRQDGNAELRLKIAAGDAGCLVQSW